jgi:hypothetical protein
LCLWTQFWPKKMLNWLRNKRRPMNWTCICRLLGQSSFPE